MAQMTGEFPRPIARQVWLTARAKNAVRRPLFIGAVGLGSFVVMLAALLLAPQQIKHVARQLLPVAPVRVDTTPLIAALTQARGRVAVAESSLAAARANPSVPVPIEESLSPVLSAERDTLSSAVNELDGLLTRAETAPLAASFRALGESPQLSAAPRVRVLLDSLSEVERDREAYATSDAADPVLLALTARTTEIGRIIEAIARERRDGLRQQMAKIATPSPRQRVAISTASDTAAWKAARDSAQSLQVQATIALADARKKVADHDRDLSAAADDAKVDVPQTALLAAAIVFGIALGFGSAFAREMRHPRVGNDHEVERTTGARVLATVRPRPRQAERIRRDADVEAPPYFDPAADGYQLTYLHVARAGASRLMLAIAGEETGIAAVIAANVAAIAADEARSTILIDTDARTAPIAAVLRTHAEPGIADVIDRRFDWTEATTQTSVGRDRVIDVIPSGISTAERSAASLVELFRKDAARMARHYEAIVVVISTEHAKAGVSAALPIPDTILCARVGHTRLADLQSALIAVRASGGNPLGVVLWDAPPPSLPSPERLARAPRPVRTAEMQALT